MADETNSTMPDLCSNTITVEQVVGSDKEQRVLEFDVIVPAQKPPIEQVVDVFVRNVEIKKIEVIPNKVIVRGRLDVKIMYIADLPDQPVHSVEMKKVAFTRDLPIQGAEPGMNAQADVVVEFVDYDFHCSKPRKVGVTVVIRVWVKLLSTTCMDVSQISGSDLGNFVDPALGGAPDVQTSAVLEGGSVSSTSTGQDMVSASGTGGGPNIVSASETEVFAHQPEVATMVKVSGTAVVTGSVVNVRSGPGTNFPVVTKVNAGTTVTLMDQAFGWFQVTLPSGQTGWIAGWLLSTSMSTTKG